MGYWQVQPHQDKVDIGVMAIKGLLLSYHTFTTGATPPDVVEWYISIFGFELN